MRGGTQKDVAGYYQYRDRLGSSVIEANESGQVISYEEYYPYGSTAYSASSSSADLSLKRYRFTGKERDEETGLDYFGVRYYASWLGRWTSADPGGFVDGLNLYRYTRNNPVNGVDAEGYSTQGPDDPPKKAVVPTVYAGNVLADLGKDYLYLGVKGFSDIEAVLSIAYSANLDIRDVMKKVNDPTLWNAFVEDRANNRWIFETPSYNFPSGLQSDTAKGMEKVATFGIGGSLAAGPGMYVFGPALIEAAPVAVRGVSTLGRGAMATASTTQATLNSAASAIASSPLVASGLNFAVRNPKSSTFLVGTADTFMFQIMGSGFANIYRGTQNTESDWKGDIDLVDGVTGGAVGMLPIPFPLNYRTKIAVGTLYIRLV